MIRIILVGPDQAKTLSSASFLLMKPSGSDLKRSISWSALRRPAELSFQPRPQSLSAYASYRSLVIPNSVAAAITDSTDGPVWTVVPVSIGADDAAKGRLVSVDGASLDGTP